MPIQDYQLPIDKAQSPLMWGEIADLTDSVIWKGSNDETTSAIAGGVAGLLMFGFGVVQGSSSDGLVYPSAVTDRFEGIVYATDSYEQRLGYTMDAAGRSGYPPRATGQPGAATFSSSPASIVRRAGRVAVPIETSVTRGGDVFMRAVLGTGQARGCFRNAAVAGETIQILRARWLTSVTVSSGLGVGYMTLEGVI